MKKWLSLGLALVMALGLLTVGGPVARAYNEGDIPGTTGTGTESDPVIVTTFAQLKAALESSDDLYIRVNKFVTELGYYELQGDADYVDGGAAIKIPVGVTKHLEVNTVIDIRAANRTPLLYSLIYNQGWLYLSGDGEIQASFNASGYPNAIVYNAGVLIVDDIGWNAMQKAWASHGYAIWNNSPKGRAVINSGTFIGNNERDTTSDISAVVSKTSITVCGGKFYADNGGTNAYGFISSDGETDLQGGEFRGIKAPTGKTIGDMLADGYQIFDAKTELLATDIESQNDSSKTILVKKAEITEITDFTIDPEILNIPKGGSGTIKVTLLPEGAEGTITYQSNDTSIATVNNSGIVSVPSTAKAGDKAIITIKAGGKQGSCVVTVTEATPATYTITFHPMGGKVSPTTATTGTDGKLASFPTPTKEGYTFTGWYAGPKGDTMVPKDTVFTEDTTVYAHWKQAEPTPTDPTVPITPHSSFKDVPDGAYFTEAVAWAVDKAVTQGTGADTFSPNATCTRGQVVTFLWRAAGSPAPAKTDNPFTDVDKSAYYADAVLWAVEKGITNGATADTFAPNQGCTRGQVVTFLHRFEETPAATDAAPFADVADSAYYAKAVAWAVEKNVTQGTGANTFSPDATCTRGQIVTFLYRDMK